MSKISKAVLSPKSRKTRVLDRLRRRGQTMVEYALILAIISVVAIGALISLSQGISKLYTSITSTISSANGSH